MWLVERIFKKAATLDFSSSGQASPRVTQVFFDDHLFANAVEFTSWEAPSFQVSICEACGTEHCQSGGWLQPRTLGAYHAFVPRFGDVRSTDPWDAAEYAPPYVVQRFGIPVLDGARLAALAAIIPDLLSPAPPLSSAEAAELSGSRHPPGLTSAPAVGCDPRSWQLRQVWSPSTWCNSNICCPPLTPIRIPSPPAPSQQATSS